MVIVAIIALAPITTVQLMAPVKVEHLRATWLRRWSIRGEKRSLANILEPYQEVFAADVGLQPRTRSAVVPSLCSRG